MLTVSLIQQTENFTMATVMQQDKSALLRNTLKANALASALSGLAFFLGSGVLAPFMGINSPILLGALGVGVMIFAFGVFLVFQETPLNAHKGSLIFVLDVIWVIGSILLLIADPLTLSGEGKWIVLILGDIVGVFAVLEYLGIRRLR
jgi:hypothetical protein